MADSKQADPEEPELEPRQWSLMWFRRRYSALRCLACGEQASIERGLMRLDETLWCWSCSPACESRILDNPNTAETLARGLNMNDPAVSWTPSEKKALEAAADRLQATIEQAWQEHGADITAWPSSVFQELPGALVFAFMKDLIGGASRAPMLIEQTEVHTAIKL